MRLLLKNAMLYTPAGVIENGCIAVNGDTIESVGTKRPAGGFDLSLIHISEPTRPY